MATQDLDPVHARQYSGLTADSFEVTLIENDSSGELLSLNSYIADEDLMAFDATHHEQTVYMCCSWLFPPSSAFSSCSWGL